MPEASPERIVETAYLSVVAPAFNEAENLPQFVEEISEALTGLEERWEIVIADDESTDDTKDVLRLLMGKHPELRVLSLRRRSGQTAALDAALRAAGGRFIATLDSDLQNDPKDIPRLLDMVASGECDMVNGWRKDRRDPLLRRITTKFGNALRNRLTHESIMDSGCGLKVFRRECIGRVKLLNGMHRFFATLVRMDGYRVTEVPVNHRPRLAGKAKYGFWNRFFKVIRDALGVRWMQSRTVLYEADEWRRQ